MTPGRSLLTLEVPKTESSEFNTKPQVTDVILTSIRGYAVRVPCNRKR